MKVLRILAKILGRLDSPNIVDGTTSGDIDPCFVALKHLIVSSHAPVQVIDIGAHCGFFSQSWLTWQPHSKIVCLEPQPAVFQQLRNQFLNDSRVLCFNVAAGRNDGTAEMRLHEYTETTSFLEMTDTLAAAAPSLAIREVNLLPVPMVKLDTFEGLPKGAIQLLKIDVQGFELEVLEGSRELLKRVEYVFAEVAFAELYVGAPTFIEIYNWMIAQGFYLVTISPHHLAGDRLLEADMLFLKPTVSAAPATV